MEVRGKRSWDWLKKDYLNKETESTIVAVRDQALYTRNMRNMVYEENAQSVCRVCGVADERVAHIFTKLEQKEYKQVRRESNVKIKHQKLYERWGFNKVEKW